MANPFLINTLNQVNPTDDKRWIFDGKDEWFLPCVIDLANKTYSGYWYMTQDYFESEHYHTGIAHGTVLQGEILLFCNNEKFIIQKNESFLLPPNLLHTAELITCSEGFLFFGVVVGDTHYVDSGQKFNVTTYHAATCKHYREQGLSLDEIVINQ